ncbi:MAG: DNA polymerase Y family protein, partial [Pseudomonadota bacterium]
GGGHSRSGDAIQQEARATRSRAGKRHWTKGGTAPAVTARAGGHPIAPPGQTYSALSPLPVAALRLEPDAAAELARLGLRRIGDVLGQPRAALARRFGKGLVLRLDQAMGSAPEPVSPAKPPDHFAVRMTLPDPIGLEEDVMAGVDRLLPQLCARLKAKGRGVRTLRMQAFRSDHGVEQIEVGLARPTDIPDRIRPLITLKLDQIDAGFGIDMLRLEAVLTEPLHERTVAGHADAARRGRTKRDQSAALEDLIGRLGARVGLDQITRRHPASSHIPEKGHTVLAAAWSDPASGPWPRPAGPRPLLMWRPEPVTAPEVPRLPQTFRWRGQDHVRAWATGPERIAPEWWLDEPDWRSGVRDYWAVETESGRRLWLYFAHGATMSAGWFCHGAFA